MRVCPFPAWAAKKSMKFHLFSAGDMARARPGFTYAAAMA
ncbi:MAG: hypothetical protein RJB22_382 [Pseudomonadota bacterium]|jgi:hypothetical protein